MSFCHSLFVLQLLWLLLYVQGTESLQCRSNVQMKIVQGSRFNETLLNETFYLRQEKLFSDSVHLCMIKCTLEDFCVASQWKEDDAYHCIHLFAEGVVPENTFLEKDLSFLEASVSYFNNPITFATTATCNYEDIGRIATARFNDGGQAKDNLITSLQVKQDNDKTKILGIGVYYGYEPAGFRGTKSGVTKDVSLLTGEVINRVEVCHNTVNTPIEHQVITMLTFYTNLGRQFGRYGNDKCTQDERNTNGTLLTKYTEVKPPPSARLRWVSGSTAGGTTTNYLTSISFHFDNC